MGKILHLQEMLTSHPAERFATFSDLRTSPIPVARGSGPWSSRFGPASGSAFRVTDRASSSGLRSVGLLEAIGHHGRVMVEQRIRRKAGFVGAFAVCAALVVAACGGGESTLLGMTREQPLEVGTVEVADVTDEGSYADHGSLFSMKARPGSLLVVYFGYTSCPDLCPTTLALVRAARRELGGSADRIDLAMITVDPDRDPPDVLNGYLSSFTDRFHALHPSSMEELKSAEEAFLASSTIVTDASGKIEVGHSATTYVVDESGIVLVEWPFGVDKDTMINDLRILLDTV